MRYQVLGGALVACGLVGATWTGGCTASKATELVPGVQTQIQVPKDLLAVRIDVQAEGQQSTCIVHSVNPNNPGFITLPRTLGVVPGAGPDRQVTITVTGYSKDDGEVPVLSDCTAPVQTSDGKYDPNVRVLRRSRLAYVGDEELFLPMNLRFSCWDSAACPPDQTCKAGQCVSAAVDPKTLPSYNDGLVSGTSNTCFDAKTCFLGEQPAKVIDQATCKYGFIAPPPAAALKGVNVRIFYGADGGESEVLDVDPQEGFTVDPTNPQEFILAPGLCSLVNGQATAANHIYQVDVTGLCTPKGVYQPICAGQTGPNAAAPLPDGGTSLDGGCNVAHPLVPAPSLLYVLMDDSSTMVNAFGAQGLQTVTSLTLGDPVFRNAQIAFTLLPHNMADCTAGTNSVATPLVAFTSTTSAQSKVATILSDTNNVKAADTTWFVDAALKTNGAYQALAAQVAAAPAGTVFNRVAVLVIANRPAAADCPIGTLPSDEAAAALAGSPSVFTYVVALNSPNGAYDTTELSAMATKGGTTMFDATSNQAIGGVALNTVESDLGSCLYSKPAGIDTGATVSYTDPLTLQTTNVTFDGTCNATSTTANGWNFDGSGVRICGAACASLRGVLTNAANVANAQMMTAPDVPVVAMEPCH
jgi:hypothetical protein